MAKKAVAKKKAAVKKDRREDLESFVVDGIGQIILEEPCGCVLTFAPTVRVEKVSEGVLKIYRP
jgi:hypothetical protein